MAETLERHLENVREECERLGFDEEQTGRMVRMETSAWKGARDGDESRSPDVV